MAIDNWSVGCILAEMLSGKPLFPGRDYHHQLTLILDVLGTPSLDDFYAISSHRSRDYLRALPFKKRRPFSTVYPGTNPLAIDLLEKLLAFNPKKRIGTEEALSHPYLEPYHDAEDEPVAEILRTLLSLFFRLALRGTDGNGLVAASFFAFDREQLSREELKRMSPSSFSPLVLVLIK